LFDYFSLFFFFHLLLNGLYLNLEPQQKQSVVVVAAAAPSRKKDLTLAATGKALVIRASISSISKNMTIARMRQVNGQS
jgi:hypothetical protein